MSEATATTRRKIRFDSIPAVKAEVNRLKGGYTRAGNWSLPQACAHLGRTVTDNLKPADTEHQTPEQAAKWQGFKSTVLGPEGMPSGMPLAADKVPPADTPDSAVDDFLKSLDTLSACGHKQLGIGSLGPVPLQDVVRLHLAHAAHHLGHLIPTAPAKRRKLRYTNNAAVVTDVTNLRKGYVQHGGWTLGQICWHLAAAVRTRMAPVPQPVPANTPEQDARRPMVEKVLATGELPTGIPSSDAMVPPADAGEAAVDDFIAAIEEFDKFSGPIPPHRLFGTLPDADARKLNLIHCAHHLSFLEPTTPVAGPMLDKPPEYRKVRYADERAAVADLDRLRKGYRQLGNWTLPMVARHVATVMSSGMKPPADPVATAEQSAMKKAFVDKILQTGNPPKGFTPPPQYMPPADCSDTDVDRLIKALQKIAAYPHPLVDMGPFGPVTIADYRNLQLVHLAHHLGFLIPTSA